MPGCDAKIKKLADALVDAKKTPADGGRQVLQVRGLGTHRLERQGRPQQGAVGQARGGDGQGAGRARHLAEARSSRSAWAPTSRWSRPTTRRPRRPRTGATRSRSGCKAGSSPREATASRGYIFCSGPARRLRRRRPAPRTARSRSERGRKCAAANDTTADGRSTSALGSFMFSPAAQSTSQARDRALIRRPAPALDRALRLGRGQLARLQILGEGADAVWWRRRQHGRGQVGGAPLGGQLARGTRRRPARSRRG